ncbi:MAG: helix-turn-helix transcriptional regulator [Saprospiraceae bacterium]|nr:helix-turn-helix transcriptional regulator [Bacteroidia bacterium]NNE14760.1 helix-turn-helix transcriptional regulator [Saprospiraceae bacterium]
MTINITQREKEVLNLISHEYTTTEIARKLYLSPHTVITHRRNLFVKLDVKNVAGLVRRGFEEGILIPIFKVSPQQMMSA